MPPDPDPNAVITPPPDPPPAEPPKPADDVAALAQKNANYFARRPDVLDATLAELERVGVVHANQRIDQLQRELDIRDVITEHGLTKEDIPFIAGRTKAELTANAAALKARYDAHAAPVTPDGKPPVKPAVAPKPAADVPPLPDHRGSVTPLAAAEADLIESAGDWCANFDTNMLGHV